MEDQDRFLYCLICDRRYKNAQFYNDHLNRKPHLRNFAKLRKLNDRNLIHDKNKWDKWKQANEPIDQTDKNKTQ